LLSRKYNKFAVISCAFALAQGLSGCTVEPEPVTLEVYSWWREASERDAFEAVIRIHEQRHPEVQVVNRADPTAKDLRKIVAERMLAGATPSSFQANLGADLLRWTVVDTDDVSWPSQNFLSALGGLFERADASSQAFGSALPKVLLDALVAGPERVPFAVPLNVHRLNVLYFNPRRVARDSLQLESLCPTAPAPKLELLIAMGLEDPHSLFLFTFENVLPALAGAKFYDDLFRGRGGPDWEATVSRALSCVQYLSLSFMPDSGLLNWSEAAERVANGQADLTVTGDWANGELRSALELGTVETMAFPNTEGTFVFTADTFPIPVGAPNPSQTWALLETMTSREAQLAFSEEKGSIPARSDVDWTALGERAQRTRDEFLAAEPVLATSGLLPPYYPLDALVDRLRKMIAPGAGPAEIAAVLTLMRDANPLLDVWQERLVVGP
jgi:glucose/mannose transport system substrate-binding protein